MFDLVIMKQRLCFWLSEKLNLWLQFVYFFLYNTLSKWLPKFLDLRRFKVLMHKYLNLLKMHRFIMFYMLILSLHILRHILNNLGKFKMAATSIAQYSIRAAQYADLKKNKMNNAFRMLYVSLDFCI